VAGEPEDMENAKPEDSPTSLTSILKDVTSSIVILVGALVVGWIERLFEGTGPPGLVMVTLRVMELILLVSFLANLVTVIVKFLLRASELLIVVRQLGMLPLLKMSWPSLGSLSRAFKTGLVASVLVTLLLLASVPLARLPSIVLIGLTVVLVVYLIIATIQNRSDLLDKGLGFAIGGAIVICVLLIVAVIIRQLGGGENLQKLLEELVGTT
jgi:hypothetical protein